MISNNNISKDDEDEIFLKEFLKGFYHQIIKIDNFENFEKILMEWTKEFFNNQNNEKNSIEKVLKLMENHKENENWFSSLTGFFYEYYDVLNDFNNNNIIIDKNKS